MEVRVLWKTFVKALNIALLLLMISPVARELGVEKQHWKNGEQNFLEFQRIYRYADAVDFVIKLDYYKQRAC